MTRAIVILQNLYNDVVEIFSKNKMADVQGKDDWKKEQFFYLKRWNFQSRQNDPKMWGRIEESVKLHALRAKDVLTCQRALRAYVITCQRALCAYMFTCQCVLHAYVLTCQLSLHAYVLTCQRALSACMLTYQLVLRAYVPTC